LGHEGDLVQAESVLRRALVVWRSAAPDNPDIATTFESLGNVLVQKGEYTEARADFLEALSVLERSFGKISHLAASALNGLCMLESQDGNTREAEDYCIRGLEVAEAVLGKSHPELMFHLNNLANVYLNEGKTDLAEQALLRDLDIQRSSHRGGQDPALVEAYSNLGWVYTEKRDLAKAAQYYRKAIDLATVVLGPDHFELAGLWINMGQYEWTRKSLDEALKDFVRAADIEEKNLSQVIAAGSESERLAYLASMQDSTSQYIALNMSRLPVESGASRLAMETVLQRKARQIEAVAASTRALRTTDPSTSGLLDRLTKIRRDMARALHASQSGGAGADRGELARLRIAEDETEREIAEKAPGTFQRVPTVTLTQVQRAIPSGAALVEFATYTPFDPGQPRGWRAPRYVAYVLFRTGDPLWADLGEVSAIDTLCVQLQASVRNTANHARTLALARDLDRIIFRPIRKYLDTATGVFLSPAQPRAICSS
jgi:tetratricopeptide (TPR) repeat protein